MIDEVRLLILKIILFTFPISMPVISVKQFGSANMDVSSLDSEVFPMEDLVLNMQFRPARISIPPQVLLEEVSKSSSEGKYML